MAQQTKKKQSAQAEKFQDGSSEIYIERHGISVSFEKANELLDKISGEQLATLPVSFVADQVAVQLDNTYLIEQLEQEKNKKSNQRREKETPWAKFAKKANGEMANGVRHHISEIYQNKFTKDKELGTTYHNMSRRYAPPVLAVLYVMNLLCDEFKQAIEKAYPNKND